MKECPCKTRDINCLMKNRNKCLLPLKSKSSLKVMNSNENKGTLKPVIKPIVNLGCLG